MSYILSIHFEDGIQDILLPGVNNRQVSFLIRSDLSGFLRDANMILDVFDGIWRVRCGADIVFSMGDGEIIKDGDMLEAYFTQTNQKMYVFVERTHPGFTKFGKYSFPEKAITIGSLDTNNISFNVRNLIGGSHAVLEKQRYAGATITDNKSQNGTFVNGKRIKDKVILKYGDEVNLFGLKIIYLDDMLAINNPKGKLSIRGLNPYVISEKEAAQAPPQDEYYQRSPRRLTQLDTEIMKIDGPPDMQKIQQQPMWMRIGPLLTMIIPMATGLMFSTVQQSGGTQSPMMYLSLITSSAAAGMGIFWAVMNGRYTKRVELEREEKRKSNYRHYLSRVTEAIELKRNYNRKLLNEAYPHTRDCMTWAVEKNLHVFERNIHHKDFLTVRLGMGKIKNPNITLPPESFSVTDDSLSEAPYNIQKNFVILGNVPVCISLYEHNLVGVIGSKRSDVTEAARIIAARVGILHAYTEVKMVFVYPENENWEFARWLPHTWADDGSIRMVACNRNSVGEVFYHLSGVIRNRTEEYDQKKSERPLPHYVVFIADLSLVENEPVMKHIMSPTPEMGFTTILFGEHIGMLPNHCTVIVERNKEFSGFYSLNNVFSESGEISFDKVSSEHISEAARALSQLSIREAAGSGVIPSRLTFLDMYRVSSAKDIDVYRNWLENRTYESMKALIGCRGGGEPLYLDLHEKYHGPHGLVAGTTGSGKSEALQTYILSLAITYHPHEVSFILIDYKGGGMAQSFVGLPHLIGVITNLGNQTNRDLASIKSEIKRREAIFNEYNIKHIDNYIELYRNGQADEPMSHLIIISDEFSQLKDEQPEFVKDLVGTSRVGRSLGVHLILATQKPDLAVSGEIWSNSRFRLCLRVQDKADSISMLKRPEAAYITGINAGRGYFQVGSDEIFEEFQSAWSGAAYTPEIPFTDDKKDEAHMINLFGKPCVLPSRVKKNHEKPDSEKSNKRVTQLTALIEHMKEVAASNNISAVDKIWIPPLKKTIYLGELQSPETEDFEINPLVGLVDDPEKQKQRPLRLNFLRENHILVCGGGAGGKTTFIQTVLYSLATSKTPNRLWIYIADFGSRTLGVFKTLPHVGGVVFDDDQDKAEKLIDLITKELFLRKRHFSERGISVFREYAEHNDDIPAILFVIDNYSRFIEMCINQEDAILTLAKEAASYGIYMLVSCKSPGDMKGRLRQNFKFGVGIQLSDNNECIDIFGTRADVTAEEHCPGRGLIKYARPSADEAESSKQVILEFQTALCVKASDSADLKKILAGEFESITKKWNGKRADPIPQIPEDMSYEAFINMPEVLKMRADGFIPIGFDMKKAELCGIDATRTLCYSVGGGIKTGKTNALKALALECAALGYEVHIVDAYEKPLEAWAVRNGFSSYISAEAVEFFGFIEKTLHPEIMRRTNLFKALGGREHAIKALENETRWAILIHDMGSLLQTIYADTGTMKTIMEGVFKRCDAHKILIAACISKEDAGGYSSYPAMNSFASWKTGIYLGGQMETQRILDFELTSTERGARHPAGVGYTNIKNETARVIMPLV